MNGDNSGAAAIFLALAIFAAGITMGLAIGINTTDEVWKKKVIERGYAEYTVVNEKTGETEFKWKEEKTKGD